VQARQARRTLLGLGRTEEALREALGASKKGPAFAHAVAAEAHERAGRLESALRGYDRAVALRPCAAYLGSRGALLQRMGRPKAALADLRRSVWFNGMVAKFQCALGAALLDLGRPRASLAALDRALGMHPDYGEALARRALAASRLAANDVDACAQLLKAVEHGSHLPPELLAAARRRMGLLARRALKGLSTGS
ncbi:MAG: tetratricopeptide repeat protein, partial [Elusimicrobia bacterium]|nr:tetratricopeptide repeat protein [Elusimicrobiota bacterium]